ncbi:type III-B CRISPR module RAMP protein Cmr1 [Meiothermus taiwanensis]|jgi:CRISPR-associated protein Cmr1|uniref:CRISPR type III-B/RAMP module RAMP protein Cmr1 n=2 Tax=Meiothermus taiwanensis TaxID=172827 RepID=A0A399E343_9DEIN|nr:type III-B CRISPR module RAMP protein Cmr1 [Meiothermus taiwanensis]AWR86729.1 CRISPR-associated RAMP protein, Cmr1 family [Meiothermus taiwanensis WR-220]KIQ53952.1 CRISPR-associated protein Cmr1 [Meiothermus taiwanensis]KZK14988.1 type III-B CRISPR module RAMP protein Cmr1 [Meiothermus taiwanensis]RIH77050.1 CRISPR type III-B/RAMP module RAMP protein Cmr1 [Meiothermus taiwanensis]
MPRTVPSTSFQLKTPALETWRLRLRTITPLFGGSATPREVDAANPIRPASVRGQLRFWWRATAGAQYASSEKLFEAEEAIWGSAEKQGRVALRILEQKAGEFVRPSDLVGDRGAAKTGPMERFFLHPFNFNKKENLPEASGLKWVEFTLELIPHLSEEEKEHLRRAIRAWIAFGGIGARTRRGVGALEVLNEPQAWLPASPEQLRAWFAQPPVENPSHTTLAGAVVRLGQPRKPSNTDPFKGHTAWRELGRFWARLRKGHFVKDPRTGETMAYTPMAGGKWNDHKTLLTLGSKQQEIALAKPYLGLPIVYQRLGNSFSGTLDAKHPQGRRMASPVILKPMAFADGSVRPAVVLLKAPLPERIQIGSRELALHIPEADPVLEALEADDPLEAVRKAAHIQGFTQEVRL